VGGRFPASDLAAYVAAQLAGAIAAAGALYVIASGKPGLGLCLERLCGALPGRLIADGLPGGGGGPDLHVSDHHPRRHRRRAPQGFAPIAIGLGLTLIHLIGIPVTNLPVNPARSTGPALFVGGWAVAQLWLFWVAPIAGAAIAGIVYPAFAGQPRKSDAVTKAESARA
jgi:aquaporin Z